MDAGKSSEEPEDPLKGYDLPEKLREYRAERRGPDPIEDFLIMENLVQNELDRLDCADDPKVAVKMFKEARQHGLEISCDSKVAELGDVRELRDRWARLDKSAISPKLRTWLDTLFRYCYYREILEILRKEPDQIRDEQKRRLIAFICWPATKLAHMWNYLVEVAAWSYSQSPCKAQETPAARAPKKAVKGD